MRDCERFRQQLDNLILSPNRRGPTGDPEILAHWTKYLCVLVSGLIEQWAEETSIRFADVRAQRPVARYAAGRLSRPQNVKMEKLVQLVGAFEKDWGEQLRADTVGEIKDAVDSIVNLRNNIAHGEVVTLSFWQLREYYKAVGKALDLLDEYLA